MLSLLLLLSVCFLVYADTASLREEIEERKPAEVALQKARDELEMRVRERTTDLAAANEQLLAEIVERKRAEETEWPSSARCLNPALCTSITRGNEYAFDDIR